MKKDHKPGQTDKFKTNWYDGWLYSKLFDPLTGKPFDRVFKKLIEMGSTALDIGCGTGTTVIELSNVCSKVTGIDISKKMIKYAQMKSRGYDNVEFILTSMDTSLNDIIHNRLDYVILKMVLHEAYNDFRDSIIPQLRKIAKNALIADFVYPQPKGFPVVKTNFIEFAAGKIHFRNFKDWCSRGGLDGYLEKHSLQPQFEKMFRDGTGKIVKVRLN